MLDQSHDEQWMSKQTSTKDQIANASRTLTATATSLIEDPNNLALQTELRETKTLMIQLQE